MSDTPRTDRARLDEHDPAVAVASECSKLERELNAVTKERDDAVFVTEKVLRDFSEHSRSHCKTLDELIAANNRIKRLEDCIETAWGIIANVSGGDWTRQKPQWQEAVVRWRDSDFHPIMKELSERKAKEAKL